MNNLTVLMAAILVLIGCSSQPRFTYVGDKDQASHRYEMFDNKTAKTCWAGPVRMDDGMEDWKYAIQRYNEAHLNQQLDIENPNPFTSATASLLDPKIKAAEDRVERLKQHPEEQKIQVNGLPYCEDLK